MSDLRQRLAELDAFLERMAKLRDDAVDKINVLAAEENAAIVKEIRILDDAIDDARRTRRFRIVKSLVPERDGHLYQRARLNIARQAAISEVQQNHVRSVSDQQLEAKRIRHQLDTQATMARQREMQERRYRKIPVMR